MRNNKGFGAIGIIIAIVLVLVAVGMGGYWLLKNRMGSESTDNSNNTSQVVQNPAILTEDNVKVLADLTDKVDFFGTYGIKDDYFKKSVKFSPDGSKVAYVSKVGDKLVVYLNGVGG